MPNALGIPTPRATILPVERLVLVGEGEDGDVVEVVDNDDISVEVKNVVIIIGEPVKVVKYVDSIKVVETDEGIEVVGAVDSIKVFETDEGIEVVEAFESVKAAELCHLLVLASDGKGFIQHAHRSNVNHSQCKQVQGWILRFDPHGSCVGHQIRPCNGNESTSAILRGAREPGSMRYCTRSVTAKRIYAGRC